MHDYVRPAKPSPAERMMLNDRIFDPCRTTSGKSKQPAAAAQKVSADPMPGATKVETAGSIVKPLQPSAAQASALLTSTLPLRGQYAAGLEQMISQWDCHRLVYGCPEIEPSPNFLTPECTLQPCWQGRLCASIIFLQNLCPHESIFFHTSHSIIT